VSPRHPYVLTRSKPIVEAPGSTVKWGPFNLPVGGGGYFRIFPYWLSAGAISLLNKREQKPAMFYVHPWEVDPTQPRIEASWLSKFRHYRHLEECEGRLDKLLSGARFTDVETVLAAYRSRHELPRMSYDATGVRPAASSGRPVAVA
jgi:hypothetical protein